MSPAPDTTPREPNPGSDEARAGGCRCPVIDNNHGLTPPVPDGWYITMGCPLHAPVPPGQGRS